MIYLCIDENKIIRAFLNEEADYATPYEPKENEDLKALVSGHYSYINGEVVYTGKPKTEIDKEKQDLRNKRKPLLEAFDLWEKAVLRGREDDSTIVMAWYRSLLDLDEMAFKNIPSAIEYYL